MIESKIARIVLGRGGQWGPRQAGRYRGGEWRRPWHRRSRDPQGHAIAGGCCLTIAYR
jgi:hypothetical protein